MQELQGKRVEQIDEVGEECRPETFEPCHAERKSVEAEEMRIDPSKNTIVCGDNLKWLNDIPDETVDLCYIDPPFFSNATYEKVWGNGWEETSFEDRFKGGVLEYIAWMKPRIELIHKKLKKTGSIFLHCDWHASHRLRCLLDDVFQPDNFINEIIWCYRQGGRSNKYFPRKHDSIFWYRRGDEWVFNLEDLRVPYEGSGGFQTSGKGVTNKKTGRTYLPNPNGKLCEDWWDIPALAPMDSERIGYPTQKPEKLISRIVTAATKEGDVVLDCFAGGFTTAKVCADLKRKFICGDVSPVACKVGAKRLNQADFHDYFTKGVPQTEAEIRKMNRHEFADMICDLMGWKPNPKKSWDRGIDGWVAFDGNNNPVQIKNEIGKTGAKDLRHFVGALTAAQKKVGVWVAWDYVEGRQGAYEFKREIEETSGIVIELRKIKELIGDLLIANEKREQIEQFYAERVPEDWVEVPLTQDVSLSNDGVG